MYRIINGETQQNVEYLDMHEYMNALVLSICGCGLVSRLLCKPDEGYCPSPQKKIYTHLGTCWKTIRGHFQATFASLALRYKVTVDENTTGQLCISYGA